MATWWRAHQPSWLAGGVGVGGLAGGSGLVLAGGRLSGQRLLHRLLDQGLHVGRRARWWDGGWRWHRGLPCCCRVALLAERVELALPLAGLVDQVLHPGRQVLHAARQLGIA